MTWRAPHKCAGLVKESEQMGWTPPERHIGYHYDRERPVKQDAAMIRADIKTLTAAGMLPGDWRYSVRYRTYSGGCSIDVTASSPRPIGLMQPGQISTAPSKARIVIVPMQRSGVDRARADEWMRLMLRPGEMHEIRWCDSRTDEAAAVEAALSDLLAGYNHDGSDSMVDYFDVKFYGHVSLDTLPGVPQYERERPSYRPASCSVR